MSVPSRVDLLIVGAGPFGLSLAAYAERSGFDYLQLGEPMGFWKHHMPAGMLLRSGPEWHLDPWGVHTMQEFLSVHDPDRRDGTPVTLDEYLRYVAWFQAQYGLRPVPAFVERLDWLEPTDSGSRFRAMLRGGGKVAARSVVLAVGFEYFAHRPGDVTERLPPGRYAHTCELVDFSEAAGRRYLIVGGRQSAFEWAALLHEAGASEVHLSYRHDTPRFTESTWGWATDLARRTLDEPEWFRRSSAEDRQAIRDRFWSGGRLQLEPWLAPRVHQPGVSLWPRTRVLASGVVGPDRPGVAAGGGVDDSVWIRLGAVDEGGRDGAEVPRLEVDQIVLATGYTVDLARVPFLAAGNLLPQVTRESGAPALDASFQTSVPGLFVTSLAAAHAFGPFFGFTMSATTSAEVIGRALTRQLAALPPGGP